MMTETTYRDRRNDEPLAQYLWAMSDVFGADERQRRVLKEAAAMSYDERPRTVRAAAGRMAEAVREELKAGMLAVTYAAQARGEHIEPFNDAGAMRVIERDGLNTVLSSEELHNTGMQYRRLFESVGHADVGSQLGGLDGQPGAARTSLNGLHAGRLHKVYASHQLVEAERAVSSALGPDGLAVLRSVAGAGEPLMSSGMSGHAKRQRRAMLRAALEVARLSFAETGGLRIRAT